MLFVDTYYSNFVLCFTTQSDSAIITHNWGYFVIVLEKIGLEKKGGIALNKLNEGFTYPVKAGNPDCLGVTVNEKKVNFAVAVPDKKSCSLLLYRKDSGEMEASVPLSTQTRYGDIRTVTIEKLPADQYEYTYRIDGEEVLDPYARVLSGREVWGETQRPEGIVRCGIPTEDYDWEGDRPLELPFEECILYTAHVRGFTMHHSSRVRCKGTFRGIVEKIPYLKELGINQLELMPVYEFDETASKEEPMKLAQETVRQSGGRINYWGYGPGYYFAPKASYAWGQDPVEELKDLVKELHKNGIELILEFHFPQHTNPNLIVDCVKYWAREYHIDGVHVNSSGAPVSALAQEPALSWVKIYSEGFPVEDIYSRNYTPTYKHLAEYHEGFAYTARRLLKGDGGQLGVFARLSRKNPSKCGVVNYISNHNGFTLADLVSYDEKHNETNGEENRDGADCNYSWNCGEEGPSCSPRIRKLRLRQSKNALAMVLLSQGIPLIYSGDECGNSQQGNNNAYCQDNELGWMNWDNGRMGAALYGFVKELVAFRRNHPALHQKETLRGTDYLCCGFPDLSYHGSRAWYGGFENGNRHLGILYAADYVAANSQGEQKDDHIYVAYNHNSMPQEFALPTLPKEKKWYVAVDTGAEEADGIYAAGQEILLKEQKTIMVKECSIVVLIGK